MTEIFNSVSESQRPKEAKTQNMDVIDIMDPEKRKVWWQEASRRVIKEAGEFPRRVLFGAYHVLPGEKFVTQQQDEEVALLLRSHPIVNIRWILLALVMFLAPTILSASGVLDVVSFEYRFVGNMAWYLVTAMVAFENFLKWYYTIFLITNERIVDIDFDNIMHRQITSVNLNHVEEPTMSTRGFVNTLFQYGDVTVQTAGEVSTMEAMKVPYPHRVVDIISRLAEDLEKRRERGE